MTEQQTTQAKQAVHILRQVAAVALLNEADRNNTNASINYLNQLFEQESQPKVTISPDSPPTA